MAWNPSPKVADARNLARRHGADRVVIVLLSDKTGTMETISYGETRLLCAQAQHLSDVAYDAIYNELAT